MSRKEPSFSELAAYLSSEKADPDYDLYLNCFSRCHEDIAAEFFENSTLLSKRKNGNYLYHEIISFKVEPGVNAKAVKDGLRDTVDLYVQKRCARNMVYGCLHQDHDHNLHYHLMISANERGDRTRLRLSQKQFDMIKRDLETHVLTHYPELKQQPLITAERQGEKMSVKAGEMKRRTGEVPKREAIKQIIVDAMSQTSTMENFIFFLSERGFQFYTRGKNFGVSIENETGKIKKYRFSTLGIQEDFEAFQTRVLQSENSTSERSTDELQGETPKADSKMSTEQLDVEKPQISDANIHAESNKPEAAEKEISQTAEAFSDHAKRQNSKQSKSQKKSD